MTARFWHSDLGIVRTRELLKEFRSLPVRPCSEFEWIAANVICSPATARLLVKYADMGPLS